MDSIIKNGTVQQLFAWYQPANNKCRFLVALDPHGYPLPTQQQENMLATLEADPSTAGAYYACHLNLN